MGEYADTRLPVYRVAKTGIQEPQAHQLAEALRIPAKGLRWLDGEASFVDRDKYLAVPSVRIEDPDIVARFTEATTNRHPEIPVAVTGIDYAALERHMPFADDLAVRSAAAALENAGLTPASARPMVGHTNVHVGGITLGLSDYGDYYWGRGAVGPTISRNMIDGWWYIKGPTPSRPSRNRSVGSHLTRRADGDVGIACTDRVSRVSPISPCPSSPSKSR
jgi:hypothetical protein